MPLPVHCFSQSKHMCCSLSRTLIFFFILQTEQNALSAHSGILFQKDMHFILPFSMYPIRCSRRGGTPRALTRLSNFSFMERSRVASSALIFALSKVS